MFDIPAAIRSVSTLADTVVKRIWPDATEVEKEKLAQITQEMQNNFTLLLSQLEVNKIEASSKSVFIAGWRPFVGWVCGVSLAYAAVLEPLAKFIAVVGFGYAGSFPVIDTEITLQVLLGLLGLAGMRSFEKSKSVAR